MTSTATSSSSSPKTAPSKKEEAPKRKETLRDLVEQIVVALILALLIRGFEAEAFVIPTGSMAPTLYGQHKEVTCPQCGEVYAVNAADESEPSRFRFDAQGRAIVPYVKAATCPNCWYRTEKLEEQPSFKGDRILVMKFLYNLPKWLGGRLPSRWDVIVFHFPEEPETNYIKRLIGLPGEVIRVYFGDILTKKAGTEEPFRIARKPLGQQQSMQQLVWDDSHRPKAFRDREDWLRWRPTQGKSWKESEPGTFSTSGDSWNELAYNHLVPEPRQWRAALTDKPIPGKPRPILITDMYGYNSGLADFDPEAEWFKPHWVGDLTVSGRITAASGKGGKVRLDLIEGGIVQRCQIDLSTGDAILSRGGKPLGDPVTTALRDDGRPHDVALANVDDRLTLWVDGKTPFGDGVEYLAPDAHPAPTAADLQPVKVSAAGGEVTVSGLVLKRDIYYTLDPRGYDYSGLSIAFPHGGSIDEVIGGYHDVLSDPTQFPALAGVRSRDFEIAPGRYMMMGDNSPRSSDSRAWGHDDVFGVHDARRGKNVPAWAEEGDRQTWEVPESLIIGKAFFIYWPHGVPLWPNFGLSRDFRLPFRPYVERMRWIR